MRLSPSPKSFAGIVPFFCLKQSFASLNSGMEGVPKTQKWNIWDQSEQRTVSLLGSAVLGLKAGVPRMWERWGDGQRSAKGAKAHLLG